MPLSRRDLLRWPLPALAVGAPSLSAAARASGVPTSVLWSLFDARFAGAQAAAAQLARGGRPQAVCGDVTVLAHAYHHQLTHQPSVSVVGVTTDLVPFALVQLTPAGAQPRLHIERFNQDLFAWTLHAARTSKP